jgi:hypothetical protein
VGDTGKDIDQVVRIIKGLPLPRELEGGEG